MQFRFIKEGFPFGSFPIFGGFTVQFCPMYRFVPFCFVYACAFTIERRSSDGPAIARAGLRPLSRKASRGFLRSQEAAKSVKNVAGKQQALQRGCLSSTKKAAFRLRAVLRGTVRNETKKNGMRMVCDVVR